MKLRRLPGLAAFLLAALPCLPSSLGAQEQIGAKAEPAPPPISNTYVFTGAHNGQRQVVEVGSRVEIQLAGQPGVWRLHLVSAPELVSAGPPRIASSPGQLAGTAGIYIFDFDVKGPARNVTVQLELLHPSGDLVLTRYKLTLDLLETE
jgi:hypothetical protein